MRSINSKIYNREYYLNTCFGADEFRKYKGKKAHPRIKEFLDNIQIKPQTRVLDLGCGRGDLAFETARRGAEVIGIDYSKDAIYLANEILKSQSKTIQNKVGFFKMDGKKLKFKNNYFDVITSFDVFEHLYKEEMEKVMNEITRVLKPGGTLLVHTETNKIYLNLTHQFWSYPIDTVLVHLNRIITKKAYPGLQKDPRNDFHKIQHVNEPTYYYLTSLFKRHNFIGKILPIVPVKHALTWKDKLYNSLVSLYPISKYFPLHLLFAHDFICIMKNNKPN